MALTLTPLPWLPKTLKQTSLKEILEKTNTLPAGLWKETLSYILTYDRIIHVLGPKGIIWLVGCLSIIFEDYENATGIAEEAVNFFAANNTFDSYRDHLRATPRRISSCSEATRAVENSRDKSAGEDQMPPHMGDGQIIHLLPAHTAQVTRAAGVQGAGYCYSIRIAL